MSFTLYDVEVETLRGKKGTLEPYRGKVMLIVNTASKDQYTPQYAGLEALQRELGPRGFSVLAFPCDQFGRGEPGSAKEIEAFCQTQFGLTLPLYAKCAATGADIHDLYRYLTAAKKNDLGEKDVRDNFEKFLVDRTGKVVARFESRATPESIRPRIEKLL